MFIRIIPSLHFRGISMPVRGNREENSCGSTSFALYVVDDPTLFVVLDSMTIHREVIKMQRNISCEQPL